MEKQWFYPESARAVRSVYNLLMNYVQLSPGVPTRMHFTDDYYVKRRIPEKESGKTKWIESHVFWVDELNGEPAARTFSVLATKLDAHLTPWVKDQLYLDYDLIITEMGDGFYKDWNIQAIKRPT